MDKDTQQMFDLHGDQISEYIQDQRETGPCKYDVAEMVVHWRNVKMAELEGRITQLEGRKWNCSCGGPGMSHDAAIKRLIAAINTAAGRPAVVIVYKKWPHYPSFATVVVSDDIDNSTMVDLQLAVDGARPAGMRVDLERWSRP